MDDARLRMTDGVQQASPADVRRALAALESVRARVTRLPSGGLDVRALSPQFSDVERARGLLDRALAEAKVVLPQNSLLLLRRPGDSADDGPEEEALFAAPAAARPTWADALLLEPNSAWADDRGFGACRAVAFWGLKGGVGRTTALAHVANLVGRRRKVLAVDLDLDSPGLVATLCGAPPLDDKDRFDDLLLLAANSKTTDDTLANAVGRCIRPARDGGGSSVWVLGAFAADANFVQRLLGPLTPAALYRGRLAPLRRVLRCAIEAVSADYMLIDARSGYCDESAMAVLDLTDEVIVFASPARSTFVSLAPAVEALERNRRALGRPSKVQFVAGMLPSDEAVRRAIGDELLAVAEETRARVARALETPPADLPPDVEIQTIEYSARIVDNEGTLVHGVVDGYREMAERLEPHEIPAELATLPPTFVSQVLQELVIPTPQAEDELDDTRLEELFTVTSKLREFARHDVSLVLGAKGTGKSFLRKMCIRNPGMLATRSGMASLANTVFLEAYTGTPRVNGPTIDPDVLRKLSEEGRPDWRAVWLAIALVQVAASVPGIMPALEAADARIHKAVTDATAARITSRTVRAIQKLARLPDLAATWNVVEMEGAKSNKTFVLVFDQLDVALGSGTRTRTRRRALIEGLLEASAFWRERRHVAAKIFLREDLWGEVDVEEKAKYITRSVMLAWSKEEIWRLCIRAFGVGSPTFRGHVQSRLGIDIGRLEDTKEEQQKAALNLIWGERMGGSDSDTFSTSWAYRRLHDGKGRLFPRAALWLLNFAAEEQKNRGLRDMPPLLSPDALRAAMPRVASQRLEELRNEAPAESKTVSALKGFASYMDEKAFVTKLETALGQPRSHAQQAVERLLEIGALERGSRREGTPTLRIVDLYAFAQVLEIDRLGRR